MVLYVPRPDDVVHVTGGIDPEVLRGALVFLFQVDLFFLFLFL